MYMKIRNIEKRHITINRYKCSYNISRNMFLIIGNLVIVLPYVRPDEIHLKNNPSLKRKKKINVKSTQNTVK